MHTADDFVGNWHLQRRLTDNAGPMSGTLDGTATFIMTAPGDLDYAEAGQLTLATGVTLQAERRYLWRWQRDLGVKVLFADGGAFHAFQPQGLSTGTPHLCGADLYDVTYDFRDWPQWEAVWHVTGPRKNYVSTSRYTRA